MAATEFFIDIVVPTVEDFDCHPGDIRRGVLACLVLQAMNEHFYKQRRADLADVNGCKSLEEFKVMLRTGNWAFGQIMDVANGVKHAKKAFEDLDHAIPAECGVMRCGFPLSSQPHVFIDKDQAWLLYQLTNHAKDWWQVKLQAVENGH